MEALLVQEFVQIHVIGVFAMAVALAPVRLIVKVHVLLHVI